MAKKLLCIATLMLALVCVLASCGHEHNWSPATCENPQACIDCEKTEGTALGHAWLDATCTAPKTCSTCNTTVGESLGHSWASATCTTPKTCNRCQQTDGESLGHSWASATCTAPKTCSTCNATVGESLGHSWTDATCEAPQTCSVCNATNGEPLAHNVSYEDGKCVSCGMFQYIPEHAVSDALGYAIWVLNSIYDSLDIYNIYYVYTENCCCDSCLNGYYAGEPYISVVIYGKCVYEGHEETMLEILGVHKKYDETYDSHYNCDWYYWEGTYKYRDEELTELYAKDYSFYFSEDDLIWIDKSLVL